MRKDAQAKACGYSSGSDKSCNRTLQGVGKDAQAKSCDDSMWLEACSLKLVTCDLRLVT
jgi:hypothetical protein